MEAEKEHSSVVETARMPHSYGACRQHENNGKQNMIGRERRLGFNLPRSAPP